MTDEYFMKMALKEAEKAFEEDEVPVGAVVVINNKIIALTSAFNSIGSKYLPDATLYVTVEPCLMCAGALHWSKVGKIVWGATDVKNGHHIYTDDRNPFHPKTQVLTGLLAEEAAALMKAFFKQKR